MGFPQLSPTHHTPNRPFRLADFQKGQVYHKLSDEREDLKVAGCWIHARCPFADFIKSVGRKTAKGTVAQEAYDMITNILHTDNEFDDPSNTGRKKQRQKSSHSINLEKYLRVFLTDGRIPPNNNYAKQAIRPFTSSRKNFILIESDNGAKASTMLYSLIETPKANEVNTYQYLELLLTEIQKHMDKDNLKFPDRLFP